MIDLSRTISPAASDWLTIVVFGALPTIGLIAGPSYAALVFGLAVAQTFLSAVAWRRLPPIDRQLALVASAFAALCWASVAWSIDPSRSATAALRVTMVFAGALLLLAAPRLGPAATDRLFRTLIVATAVGSIILVIDTLLNYRLQQLLVGRLPPFVGSKYNRGVDHLVLLIWPMLGYLWHRRNWHSAALLVVPLLAALALTQSLAAQTAVIAGLLVLLVAWQVPRLVAPALACSMAMLAVGTPFALNRLAADRQALAHHLKNSGLHRLEIWDHMTSHVLARPVLGWGIASATRLPITPQELSHYVILNGANIYPHDQWLELWVETGAIGAAIGLVFAVLVLLRIQRLASVTRPFAYAAFAAAVTISCVNFEVMTDSWWAAIAASAFLFMALESVSVRASQHAVVSAERA